MKYELTIVGLRLFEDFLAFLEGFPVDEMTSTGWVQGSWSDRVCKRHVFHLRNKQMELFP